ncbi:unnamed protein product, partial [Ectocarpus sp. 12 AP-2014]
PALVGDKPATFYSAITWQFSRRISYRCGPTFAPVSEIRTARNTRQLLHCFRASQQQHVFNNIPGHKQFFYPKSELRRSPRVPLTPTPFYRTPLLSMHTFNIGLIKKTSDVLRCINQKYKVPRTGLKRSLLST